jgi:hypothetical protein
MALTIVLPEGTEGMEARLVTIANRVGFKELRVKKP